MKNSSVTPTISTEKPGLLINRNFALLWSGQIISIVGDFVFETTLILWIVTLIAQGQPWASLAVSGILLAASLPAFIIGPIAGVFVDRWDKRGTMLWVDALRAILAIRPPEVAVAGGLERQSNFLREFGQGIHFYAGNPVLMTILISGILVVFINGALNALDIFFVTQNLHTSVSLYGLLSTVLGAGLIVGALLAGALAQRLGLTRTFWLSLVVGGVLVLVYARLTSVVPALVVLFLLGMVTTAVNVVAGPLVLHVTPRELVGRVASV